MLITNLLTAIASTGLVTIIWGSIKNYDLRDFIISLTLNESAITLMIITLNELGWLV